MKSLLARFKQWRAERNFSRGHAFARAEVVKGREQLQAVLRHVEASRVFGDFHDFDRGALVAIADALVDQGGAR